MKRQEWLDPSSALLTGSLEQQIHLAAVALAFASCPLRFALAIQIAVHGLGDEVQGGPHRQRQVILSRLALLCDALVEAYGRVAKSPIEEQLAAEGAQFFCGVRVARGAPGC